MCKSLFRVAAFTAAVTAFAAAAPASMVVTHVTDFDSATPAGTDGRDTGFGLPFGISATFDTTQGWTWYTENSTTNDNLTIPFVGDGGSQTIGEQGIRVGAGLELQSNAFSFGWGATNAAIALRSQTYTDIIAGTASLAWVANNSNLKAFYSQNGGASWTATTNGANFAAIVGTIEVVLVGNDGVDSNTLVDTATLTYVSIIPTPAAAPAGLALLGLTALRRRR